MYKKIQFLFGAIALLFTVNAQAISINFDYSYDSTGFFDIGTSNGQLARNLMQDAGNFFATRITDQLGAITPGGVNTFDINFFNPSDTTNPVNQTINNFTVAANTLTVFVGADNLGGSLGLGGPGGYSIGGTAAFTNSVNRGQGVVDNPGAVDFAPWGGSISFNSTSNWYFDTDSTTDEAFGGNDFYSVALHELGHVLGFSTADSWTNQVSGGNFNGTNSVAANGGPVALDGTSHWAPGTTSLVNGIIQEAAMDPDLTTGTRKRFTDLDMAALFDIGWEVSATPVPVPPAILLFTTGLLGLVSQRKKAFA